MSNPTNGKWYGVSYLRLGTAKVVPDGGEFSRRRRRRRGSGSTGRGWRPVDATPAPRSGPIREGRPSRLRGILHHVDRLWEHRLESAVEQGFPSGQRGAGCKPAGSAFRGSNPLPCTASCCAVVAPGGGCTRVPGATTAQILKQGACRPLRPPAESGWPASAWLGRGASGLWPMVDGAEARHLVRGARALIQVPGLSEHHWPRSAVDPEAGGACRPRDPLLSLGGRPQPGSARGRWSVANGGRAEARHLVPEGSRARFQVPGFIQAPSAAIRRWILRQGAAAPCDPLLRLEDGRPPSAGSCSGAFQVEARWWTELEAL